MNNIELIFNTCFYYSLLSILIFLYAVWDKDERWTVAQTLNTLILCFLWLPITVMFAIAFVDTIDDE